MTIILPLERQKPEALTSIGEYAALAESASYERTETMNPTQFGGIFRDVIKALGVVFVAKGWVDGGMLEMIAGGAAALAASAWSWYTNKTSTMVSAVAASDEVEKVVTTPAMAAADPSPKVTSA